jgi:hypothetical protein
MDAVINVRMCAMIVALCDWMTTFVPRDNGNKCWAWWVNLVFPCSELDRNESRSDTSITRNQRGSNAGVGAFQFPLLSVLCLRLVLSKSAAKGAPGSARQQTEVSFLSSADPDLHDIACMIEQIDTHILDGSDKPVHFNLTISMGAQNGGGCV